MKVKLETIVSARPKLEKLFSLPLPAKTSYRVMRLMKKITSELKMFEQKRIDLVKKYGEPTENNKNIYNVKPDEILNFQKDMQEVLDVEIEIEFEPLTLDMLGNNAMSASDLLELEEFIKE